MRGWSIPRSSSTSRRCRSAPRIASRETVAAELARRGVDLPFAVVSNPEFLKEGAAVEDFMRPDRVVIGADDERAIGLLRAVYAPFQRNHERLLVMDVRSAELTKYAANAMLATRISFMNELANLADALGADIEHVQQRHRLRSAHRLSLPVSGRRLRRLVLPQGRQGACRRPRSTTAARSRFSPRSSRSTTCRKSGCSRRSRSDSASISPTRRFAVWGSHSRPTPTTCARRRREPWSGACSIAARALTAYDPVAMDEARRVFGTTSRLAYAASPMDAVAGADALVVVTEWQEFRSPDFGELERTLRQPLLFDGRNLYRSEAGARRRTRIFRHRPAMATSCKPARILPTWLAMAA